MNLINNYFERITKSIKSIMKIIDFKILTQLSTLKALGVISSIVIVAVIEFSGFGIIASLLRLISSAS